MKKKYDIKRLLKIAQGFEEPADVDECCFEAGYMGRIRGQSLGEIVSNVQPDPDIMDAENLRFFIFGIIIAEKQIEELELDFVMSNDDDTTH